MVQSLGPFGYNINAGLDQLASGPRGKFELWAPIDPHYSHYHFNYVCTLLVHIEANSRFTHGGIIIFCAEPLRPFSIPMLAYYMK